MCPRGHKCDKSWLFISVCCLCPLGFDILVFRKESIIKHSEETVKQLPRVQMSLSLCKLTRKEDSPSPDASRFAFVKMQRPYG